MKRKKNLAWRVKVSKWRWPMVDGHGALEKGTRFLVGRVKVSKWGRLMARGAFEKEQEARWEGQGV